MDTVRQFLQNAPPASWHSASEGLALVLEAANAGYYDHFQPPEGRAFVSEGWLNLLGLTRAEAPPPSQFRSWLVERVHPEDRQKLSLEYEALLSGRTESYSIDVRMQHGAGHWVWVQGVVRAIDVDELGRVRRAVGIMLDITKRKQREERRELLIRELHHRAKNMLAVIQSLAFQTFKGDTNSREALAAFNARLKAIAAAQGLLINEQADSIDFAKLAADIAGRAGPRVKLGGPTLLLPAPLGVAMAMALNELYTNALKYGALSVETGHVSLVWRIYDEARPSLKIEWREEGGPPVRAPSRRGFGTRLIERSLTQELNGSVNLDFAPSGLVCSIIGPLPTVCCDAL